MIKTVKSVVAKESMAMLLDKFRLMRSLRDPMLKLAHHPNLQFDWWEHVFDLTAIPESLQMVHSVWSAVFTRWILRACMSHVRTSAKVMQAVALVISSCLI